MQIEAHSAERLVIRDAPGCLWLLGAGFVVLGAVATAGPLGLFTDRAALPLWAKLLTIGLGLSTTGAGIYTLRRTRFTRATFDRASDTLTVARSGPLSRPVRATYALRRVRDVEVVERPDQDGSPLATVWVRLGSGERVALSVLESHDRAGAVRARDAIRTFLAGEPAL